MKTILRNGLSNGSNANDLEDQLSHRKHFSLPYLGKCSMYYLRCLFAYFKPFQMCFYRATLCYSAVYAVVVRP